ncbi:protein kinase superfamily protein [Striga asiatica]|uniref:Protein kinase superfamily protein n=1 Tax=Striga asiatica TaxID=4170 RepID=A0A5A7QMI0_STRAF|nr:protein kinase superfamily protein [Striga asiatica]
MHEPITTTSSVSGSSHAFHRWKQKQSGTSTHLIPRASRAFLSSTPNRDILFSSYTTGDPPHAISDRRNTTCWSGTTTKFSVMAKSCIMVGSVTGISTSSDFVPSLENLKYLSEHLAGGRVELRVGDHGGRQLAVEVVAADGLEVAVEGDADVVGEVVLGHGEEAGVEEDEAGVGDAGAVSGVDEAEEAAGVEEGEAGDAGVAVELADGFGEDGAAEGELLGEAVGLGEAAGVGGGGGVVEGDGVDHAVSVEEVVAGEGLEEGVGAVAEVDAADGVGDLAGDGEGVADGLLGDGGEVAGDLDVGVGVIP